MDAIEYMKTEWLPKDSDGNIPANAPAINAENLNRIENGIENCVNAINDLNNSQEKLKEDIPNLFKRESLWVNGSPKANMGETIINMDLSEYVRFMVLCKAKKDEYLYSEHYISCKDRDMRIVAYTTSDYTYSRHIKFTNNTITISNTYRGTSELSTYNNYGIVVEIYGYKN